MSQVATRQRLLPYLLLVVSTAAWGGTWVAARAVHADVPPAALTFWRWLSAALIIAPFVLAQIRDDAPVIKRNVWLLFGVCALGTAGYNLFGNWAVHYTTAINASLFNGSVPLFVVPIAWLLLGLTVNRVQVLGLVLSLAGVLVILTRGDLQVLRELTFNPGDLLMLGACLAWCVYTVLLRWRPKMHEGSFVFVTCVAGAAAAAPFYLGEMLYGLRMELTPWSAAIIAYLAVGPSVIGYLCFNRAVQVVGPNVAGFFNPLIPVFGSIFAMLFLDEPLQFYHVPGFLLVAGGIWFTSRR